MQSYKTDRNDIEKKSVFILFSWSDENNVLLSYLDENTITGCNLLFNSEDKAIKFALEYMDNCITENDKDYLTYDQKYALLKENKFYKIPFTEEEKNDKECKASYLKIETLSLTRDQVNKIVSHENYLSKGL
jgi:hypothetical protein